MLRLSLFAIPQRRQHDQLYLLQVKLGLLRSLLQNPALVLLLARCMADEKMKDRPLLRSTIVTLLLANK